MFEISDVEVIYCVAGLHYVLMRGRGEPVNVPDLRPQDIDIMENLKAKLVSALAIGSGQAIPEDILKFLELDT